MLFIADLHIHSHYSRATSKQMNTSSLYKWGQIKGIRVLGTGDFTHPEWFMELQEKLEEAEPGFFKLKEKYAKEIEAEIPSTCKNDFRFILSSEISNIYSKNGKCRKVHIVVTAPSFAVAGKINSELAKIGNLQADGRPILGLDSKKLLKIVMEASEDCMFIPAHVWTPHFAVFGSNSGFDSLEECFEELTPCITALETGLSSDPEMNWRLSKIDNFTLVSNSDAHSPGKLGREANRLNTEFSYFALKNAIKKGDPNEFIETIEFFPQEGKYHYDGHRLCNVCFSPKETREHKMVCPKCEKPLTIGVMHRVEELADRKNGDERKTKRVPFRSLIPLPEILANIVGTSASSKKVQEKYFSMLHNLGNEFDILLDIPIQEIEKVTSRSIAKAISNLRLGNVELSPGYDGEYGKIKMFSEEEKKEMEKQMSLF